MTNNSDLNLMDLRDHECKAEVPISTCGRVIGWACHCGMSVPIPKRRRQREHKDLGRVPTQKK